MANSPGAVELNVSSPSFQMRASKGVETLGYSQETGPGFTGAGPASAKQGVTQVFVQPGLGTEMTARVTAHEMRHARRFRLGQTYEHIDRKTKEPRPEVGRETNAAAAEAARNVRERQ